MLKFLLNFWFLVGYVKPTAHTHTYIYIYLIHIHIHIYLYRFCCFVYAYISLNTKCWQNSCRHPSLFRRGGSCSAWGYLSRVKSPMSLAAPAILYAGLIEKSNNRKEPSPIAFLSKFVEKRKGVGLTLCKHVFLRWDPFGGCPRYMRWEPNHCTLQIILILAKLHVFQNVLFGAELRSQDAILQAKICQPWDDKFQ